MTARLVPGGGYAANTPTARLLPDGAWLVVSGGGGSSNGNASAPVSAVTISAISGSASGITGGATGSGSIAAISLTASSGFAVGGTSAGTLAIGPLVNNTGSVLADASGITVYVYQVSGALVVTKTSQTTNGSGILTVSDVAMTPGVTYRYIIVMASGAEGMDKQVAA